MSKVFVSGCYDILHAGHIQFLKEAKELGDELIVCVPSDEVLFLCKSRRPSIPLFHKMEILKNGSGYDVCGRILTTLNQPKPPEDCRMHTRRTAACSILTYRSGKSYVRL